jgi:hypothetical protein
MGITHSIARWAAPLAFIIDFAAQQYGIFSSPNMKDVHDQNISFWSPQPYFIGAFFFPQQILQLAWLYRLYKLDPKKSEKVRREVDTMVDYVPFYIVGNLCLASKSVVEVQLMGMADDWNTVWMIFWNSSALKTSNVFVVINSVSQLYYIALRQPRMNTASKSSILTHLVSKSFAGIGFLDLLHNGSVAYFDHQGPNTIVKVITGVGFGAVASFSDWIFGGCLVYDLVALAVGQRGVGETGWSNLLAVYALATAAIVGVRNWVR